jgi:hypothetical protein
VQISGAHAWAWQPSPSADASSGKSAANGVLSNNLDFADREKDRTFIDTITSDNPHNQIAAGVESALSCMLGRMAAYRHREVTWEDLLAHGETYQLGLNLDQFA